MNQKNSRDVVVLAMEAAGFYYRGEQTDGNVCFQGKNGFSVMFSGWAEIVYWMEKYLEIPGFPVFLNQENSRDAVILAMETAGFHYREDQADGNICFRGENGFSVMFSGWAETVYWMEKYLETPVLPAFILA